MIDTNFINFMDKKAQREAKGYIHFFLIYFLVLKFQFWWKFILKYWIYKSGFLSEYWKSHTIFDLEFQNKYYSSESKSCLNKTNPVDWFLEWNICFCREKYFYMNFCTELFHRFSEMTLTKKMYYFEKSYKFSITFRNW